MKPTSKKPFRPRSLRTPRLVLTTTAASILLLSPPARADLPTPLVSMQFSEGTGSTTTNSGSLGGTAYLVQPDGSGYPMFTNLVPTGLYAPTDDLASMDFGLMADGQYGRAVDLITFNDPYGLGTLGTLNAFTICGWLNARDLTEGPGGNRIAFALDGPNGSGFDLVQLGNGALRIGINQWPDGDNGGGPVSSAGRITADPQAGATNWVFFAVTYDSTLPSGNLKYFFGAPQSLASPDSSYNYTGLYIGLSGEVPYTGPLTAGNFGSVVMARDDAGVYSRVFRGLINQLRVYDQALDLSQVQQAQLNGELPPVPVTITRQPGDKTVFTGQAVTFTVQVAGAAPYTYQWQRDNVDIPGETGSSYTLPVASLADSGATFRVKVGNPVVQEVLSDTATLTVLPDDGRKILFSFSDGGTTVTNTGNLRGTGVYLMNAGYPAASANVPVGAFVPGDNVSSVDFGTIAAGQGGRSIDLSGGLYGGGVGPMNAFTLTAWVNCRDLSVGPGGNRIVCAHNFNNDPGFDLVQNDDGSLRLGVNSWPDWPAATVGPYSSPGKITADPTAGPNNWVFIAVTYDAALESDNVKYYFGTPSQAATLDVAATYRQGVFASSGDFTVGNLNPSDGARNDTGSNSRCFRGLIDEVKVLNQALSQTDIQALQVAPAYRPSTIEPVSIQQDPQNLSVFEGQDAAFGVNASGTPPLSYQWWTHHAGSDAPMTGMTNASLSVVNATVAENGDQFWVVVANASNSVTSLKASLTVLPENNHKVALSFSEGQGTNTADLGNLGGTAAFVQTDGYPAFSSQVPSGPYAPSNNTASVDFGVISDGQGGRAVDLTDTVTPTVGSMQGFTLTGWLNCEDLQVGPGGNRILFDLDSPGGAGFDLVQYPDGSLHLGVNAWADSGGNPVSSPMITADPSAGQANWVFFAVTYDGTLNTGNVSYYFGSPWQPASLDFTPLDYAQGVITKSGTLTVGNFSGVVGDRNATNPDSSRCFRGLMDELNVFNRVLSLEEIQNVQTAPAGIPIQAARLNATLRGNQMEISWDSSSDLQLQYCTDVGSGTWADETTAPAINGTQHTVTVPASGSARFYRLVSR